MSTLTPNPDPDPSQTGSPDHDPNDPPQQQPQLSMDEYITLCATLHNTLLAKSTPPSHDPNLPIPKTGTLLPHYHASHHLLPNPIQDITPAAPHPSIDPTSPLYCLLSQLQTTTLSDNHTGRPSPLTPRLYQPDPAWFFPSLFAGGLYAAATEYDPPRTWVLLYPQRVHGGAEPYMDGGLFVDADTLLATWVRGDDAAGVFGEMDGGRWVGLDVVLRGELDRWEGGRYGYVHVDRDGEEDDGGLVRWVGWVPVMGEGKGEGAVVEGSVQVAEAVAEWERLLGVIEERMGREWTRGDDGEWTRGDDGEWSEERWDAPLGVEVMEGLYISRFATAFLSRARRPRGWKLVAPGIGFFDNDEMLRQVYSVETQDSRRRRTAWDEDSEDWVTLLLPGRMTVPVGTSEASDQNIKLFDRGFGELTVGRRAGLYTTFGDIGVDGDLVQLVCPSGRTDCSNFGERCPRGPDRHPRLAEVLGHWANLVEDGMWNIGKDGVEEDAGWFDSHLDLARLDRDLNFAEW